MLSNARYGFPTDIRFGPGVASSLADVVRELGHERPLIITDAGVAALSWYRPLVQALADAGLEVAEAVHEQGNPTAAHVDVCVQAFQGHTADCVVAIGGGAPVDVAKAAAVMARHAGRLFDYEDVPGARPINGDLLPPIIAIPTTAGTGSEVGRSAVISENDSHVKKIIFHPKLLPVVVLADPELHLGLPPKVTAATGVDALTHLVEAFLAKGDNPLCDGLALEGVYLVSQHLAEAVSCAREVMLSGVEALDEATRARHVLARGRMLQASMMGAIAFQKGLGLNHSCAHALSTVRDLHHGLANALMLPQCMAYNAVAVPEAFERLAVAARCKEASAAGFLAWIDQLLEDVGISVGLGNHGVEAGDIPALVTASLADVCHPLGPRAVDADGFTALFQGAL
ncbi:MAG: iron-containing alcohol dehydrogenase [Bradymonadia bacterium]